MNRIVAVNVGNTNTAVALMAGARVVRRVVVPTRGVTAAVAARALTRLRAGPVAGGIAASVVPRAGRIWLRALAGADMAPVVEVRHDLNLGVRLDYPRPETLGADRLANLAGLAGRTGRPVIVIDAGTATTLDAVTANGVFVGGAIAPGPALMLDYLADRTAKLPRLSMRAARGSIGRNTAEAMQIAADAGYAGLLRGIAGRMVSDRRLHGALLIATGGGADLVRRAIPSARIDRDLTFRGLARIFGLTAPACRTGR
ncbi:MAG: type III pantothenate kinase [Verrucomicrobia bacterium]|nr:type III pantothenate kinase [Verrucomicrobiota bacterium]